MWGDVKFPGARSQVLPGNGPGEALPPLRLKVTDLMHSGQRMVSTIEAEPLESGF